MPQASETIATERVMEYGTLPRVSIELPRPLERNR